MNIFVLTGAGISAESGIKTFRDQNGLWENHRIEDVATPEAFKRQPEIVQNFYNQRRKQLLSEAIKPNAAHYALAELELKLPSSSNFLLCTQNIDDLHERAGSKETIHMHGELLKARCSKCELTTICRSELSNTSLCKSCGSPLRPHIVWFGEVPFELDRIFRFLETTDLFLAIGTSGQVYPAASFVREAKNAGAKTIEFNLKASEISSFFDEHFWGLAGESLPRWLNELGSNF